MTRRPIHRFPQKALLTTVVRFQTAMSSSDRGGVLAEYGLLISFVLTATIAFIGLFGDAVVGLFTDANDQYPQSSGSTSS